MSNANVWHWMNQEKEQIPDLKTRCERAEKESKALADQVDMLIAENAELRKERDLYLKGREGWYKTANKRSQLLMDVRSDRDRMEIAQARIVALGIKPSATLGTACVVARAALGYVK